MINNSKVRVVKLEDNNNKAVAFYIKKGIFKKEKLILLISVNEFSKTKDNLVYFKRSKITNIELFSRNENELYSLINDKDVNKYLTDLQMYDYIKENMDFVLNKIKIKKTKNYKMVQDTIFNKTELTTSVVNIYYPFSVEDNTILQELYDFKTGVNLELKNSIFDVTFNLINVGSTKTTITISDKGNPFLSIEYDVDYGKVKAINRFKVIENVIYEKENGVNKSVSFSDISLPIIDNKEFVKFYSNKPKNEIIDFLEKIKLREYLIMLNIYSKYLEFLDTEDTQNVAKNNEKIDKLNEKISDLMQEYDILDRNSQALYKKLWENSVIKTKVHTELVKNNIVNIEETYIRENNPTINDGVLIKLTHKDFEMFFKIDNIHTTGNSNNSYDILYNEMLNQIKGYISFLGKIRMKGIKNGKNHNK